MSNYTWWVWVSGFILGLGLSMVLGSCEPAHASEIIAIRTIMGEAANQDYEGQLAVAEVIRNRVKEKCIRRFCFEDTVHKVVLAPKQFSFWNSKNQAMDWLDTYATEEAWQRASKAWYMSEFTKTVKGATHYHTKDVKPYWAKKMRLVARVGDHFFYKERRR